MSNYAWSALTVVVVVGALFYMDVFNSDNYAKEGCDLGSQLVCDDVTLIEDGTFELLLRNQFTRPITVESIIVNNDSFSLSSLRINPGKQETISIETEELHPVDSFVDIDYEVSYKRDDGGSNREYSVLGTATVNVIEEDTGIGVIVDFCTDKTPLNTCSSSKPLYCDDDADLIPLCDKCGCDDEQICNEKSGECEGEK